MMLWLEWRSLLLGAMAGITIVAGVAYLIMWWEER